MPVLNAGGFLDAAIESILRQSFDDFEFVIFDDGSTDGSMERLRYWAARDGRIRLFGGEGTLGPVGSSNRVVEQALAPLIARMDADDVADPGRLARQVDLFARVPEAVLVASLHDTIDEAGQVLRAADRARLLRASSFAPFAHGSIMVRRAAFDAAGGYRAGCDWWEDIDLYLRMAEQGRVLVLTQSVFRHRIAATGTRIASRAEAVALAFDRLYYALQARQEPEAQDGKIAPAAFPLLGSMALWAGRRPRLLAMLLKHGRLKLDGNSARALAWTAWADSEPRSLRMMLRLLLAARNRRAARLLGDAQWVEWRSPSA